MVKDSTSISRHFIDAKDNATLKPPLQGTIGCFGALGCGEVCQEQEVPRIGPPARGPDMTKPDFKAALALPLRVACSLGYCGLASAVALNDCRSRSSPFVLG